MAQRNVLFVHSKPSRAVKKKHMGTLLNSGYTHLRSSWFVTVNHKEVKKTVGEVPLCLQVNIMEEKETG